jgi:enterochelin esterase-like enzyme
MSATRFITAALMLFTALGVSQTAPPSQPERPAMRPPQGPQVVSPEVLPDRRITFRILAPQAESINVAGGDIPGNGPGTPMTKGESGIWEATLGPVPAGAYRYNFNVAGMFVVDPRNPLASASNNNIWSLVIVPGSDFQDTRNVPHGAVASVTYYSTALDKFRRMHVYTPPGYENNKEKYPVFYLLHGASDSDESWSTVGRAGFILDNLIAANKAKPMIVVMPAGHTALVRRPQESDEVLRDFTEAIVPYIEKNYRVLSDRRHQAIAGLSMGGGQTLNIFAKHPEKFAYVGVYSSGLLGSFGPMRPGAPVQQGPSWEESHKDFLDNASAKKGLKLFWFATGKEDSLMATTKGTVELYRKHGFDPVFKESEGGHTWLNWRDYLNEFVPQLFQ